MVRLHILLSIGKPIILVSAINPGLRQHRVQALRCARLERLIIRASYFIHFPFGQVNKKNLGSNNLFRLIH